jgi:hypothetical protein
MSVVRFILAMNPANAGEWASQVMDEAAFQAEVFKLRSREWPYYLAANRDSLQAVPDLSDLSGGLSNPSQFNFIMYILWKARQGPRQHDSCCSNRIGLRLTTVHHHDYGQCQDPQG